MDGDRRIVESIRLNVNNTVRARVAVNGVVYLDKDVPDRTEAVKLIRAVLERQGLSSKY